VPDRGWHEHATCFRLGGRGLLVIGSRGHTGIINTLRRTMNDLQETDNTLVLSYLDLRKSVGTVGILLPFVLSVGKTLLDHPGILNSVSSYYYSVMGNVFVGSMCAIGVFLWSYKGYDWRDSVTGTVAAIGAVCVALFPTAPDTDATLQQINIGTVHIIFAGVFFLALAYFSLVLFRLTDPSRPPTRMKLVRNKVYTVCGYVIIVAIALIAAVHLLPADSRLWAFSPVFWLESLAIVAFGISWFVKGARRFFKTTKRSRSPDRGGARFLSLEESPLYRACAYPMWRATVRAHRG
jgi:hypothetical protein